MTLKEGNIVVLHTDTFNNILYKLDRVNYVHIQLSYFGVFHETLLPIMKPLRLCRIELVHFLFPSLLIYAT